MKPDRAARRDDLRAAAPLRLGSVTLLPVERVVLRVLGEGFVLASKEPYALVVRDAAGTAVVALEAAETSLAELRERIPGLDAALAAAMDQVCSA